LLVNLRQFKKSWFLSSNLKTYIDKIDIPLLPTDFYDKNITF